jgi:hypothetical protein
MEVSKVPQADVSAPRTGTTAGSSTGSATALQTPTSADTAASAAAEVTAATDFADIRPLDLGAALQILVAEVRAGLDASLEGSMQLGAVARDALTQALFAPTPGTQGAILQSPLQAAHELVDMFLRALPEDTSDAPAWTAAVIQAETAVQSSLERAVNVVAAWRDTSPLVVDAAKEARVLFTEALADEGQNPVWLRPEWMGLVAPFSRFRRRRRNVRRRLADPDYPVGNLDDDSEEIRR